MKTLEVYTDGSCYPNPNGKGGWAYVVVEDDKIIHEDFGKEDNTTNNRMELLAIINALSFLQENAPFDDITVYSDSKYCVNGYNKWMHGWQRADWKYSSDRANIDLWKELYEFKGYTVKWIKGHSENKFNDRADELANYKRNVFKARPYQEPGIQACIEILTSKKKCKELVVVPTAGGKSWYISEAAKVLDVPVVVLQPSKELLVQNYSKYISCGGKATIYSASLKLKTKKKLSYTVIDDQEIRCDEISNFTYATIGSILKHADVFKKMGLKHLLIDEAHLSTKSGSQIRQFINTVGITNVLGLTATPIYLEGGINGARLIMMNRARWKLFSNIRFVTQIYELVEAKFWTPLNYKIIDTDESYLKENSNGSDFTVQSQVKYYEANNLKDQIKEELKNLLAQGRKSILVFLPTIAEAEQLFSEFPNSAIIHSKIDSSTRDYVVKAFKNLDIPVVFNINILSTGFDHPELDAIITARSTSSIAIFYQQIGRLVRIHENKKDGIVTDFSGNVKRFGRVEDLTFENIEGYGWGMFGKDGVLLTDYPISAIRRPTKESLIKSHKREQEVLIGNSDSSVVFWFGKHKGKSVKRVVAENKNYVTWIYDQNDWDWTSPKMSKLRKSMEIELKLI